MIFVWPTPQNFAEMQAHLSGACTPGEATIHSIFRSLPQNRPQLTVEAILEKDLVRTLTVGLDSAEGMLLDELYESEIRTFRHKKRKLCELSDNLR